MARLHFKYKSEKSTTSSEITTLKTKGNICESDIAIRLEEGVDVNSISPPIIEEVYDESGNFTEAHLYGYTMIRYGTFGSCPSLTTVSLPEGLTIIDNDAFYGCASLILSLLPSGLTHIGDSAFYGCTSLALTSLPAGLTDIGVLAFYGCESLALTSLPAGLTSIGASAFEWCTALTTLTFEGTPDSISATAFNNCNNLTTINVPWAEGEVEFAPWGAENATINYNYTGETE